MKNNLRTYSCLFLLVLCSFLYGQNNSEKISINFNDLSLREVFLKIEANTNYKFFFSESWLQGQRISQQFNDTPIKEIISVVLKDTNLNAFFLSGSQIIITQNNLIYDSLPENYFPKTEEAVQSLEEEEETNEAPVFIDKRKEENREIKTVRIGKERRGNANRRFKLSGYVTDASSGAPLANIPVVVLYKGIGIETDRNGYYELNIPQGSNTIELQGMGVESMTTRIIIYDDGVFNFKANSEAEELEEVVLQSQGVKNIEDTNVGKTEISTEESKSIPLVLGERDVLRVATLQPGITTAGEGATGYNVRGGKTDQNLVLLEGGVIYNPSHFFGIFQALNPLVISGVDIYKGNIPAEFGGRISSVFDIKTKNTTKEEFGADISVGPVTANVVLETPVIKDKSGLMVGARGTYSDWVLRALDEANLENSEASFYDFVVKYDHNINDKNSIQALGYYSRDAFSISSDSLFGYSNRLVSLKWNSQLNEKNDIAVTIANSQYKFDIDYSNTENDDFLQTFQIDETALKLKMITDVNEKHTFTYGLEGKYYGVFPGTIEPRGVNNSIVPIAIPKEQGVEAGLYFSDAYTINDKLELDFGIRLSAFSALGEASKFEYEENTPRSENTVIDTVSYGSNEPIKWYGGPEFRLAARYLLSDDLSVKASANNTFQYIHTLSNNTTVSPIDIWKLSDNFIRPQQATQVSLGLFKNIDVNAFEVSLEGFYKWQKDIIDFKTGADIQLNEAIEREVLQGTGRAYGIEFLFKKNNGDLTGWLGYTYSRSFFKLESQFEEEEVNDGEFFPSNYDKPHDVSLVMNYKLSQRISVSSNFLYQTGRPVTFPTGNYQFNGGEFVLYSDRNQFRIPDYYRLDLGINFEGNHKKNKIAHSFWSLSVYNVLGRNNPYSIFFVDEEGEIKALQSSIFNIPVPSLTYNISF